MTFQPVPSGRTLIDRYQVLNLLGAGGMGRVYLARDLRFSQRHVALKENADRAPAAQAQFRLEADMLATLAHPHLPAVTDHFITPDGRQFLVMEYVEGENLEDRVLRSGLLSEGQALTWVDQVLDALVYLHGQSPPIIHRDVKPDNLRITPEGKAVLVDFGVAKYMQPGQRTATAARAGSPGYAAIEQYAGGTDHRSDLYSLGATFYFALTGSVPPEAPLRAAGRALTPPRRLNPAISRQTEAAILRAMETDPQQRFQSASHMRSALVGKKAGRGAGRGRIELRGWQKIALGGLAGTLLLVCGVLGWVVAGEAGGGEDPTRPPESPTATMPQVVVTVAPTAEPTGTAAPLATDTVPAGQATSTPRPTPTPDPDPDRDGFIGANDVFCPYDAGTTQGCPDADGDGVRDSLDACPNEYAQTEDGCPVPPTAPPAPPPDSPPDNPPEEPTEEPTKEPPTVNP
jgi:hypothetical protein